MSKPGLEPARQNVPRPVRIPPGRLAAFCDRHVNVDLSLERRHFRDSPEIMHSTCVYPARAQLKPSDVSNAGNTIGRHVDGWFGVQQFIFECPSAHPLPSGELPTRSRLGMRNERTA
ncbi:hypothetical protein ZHAS_00017276 [Anopheles sinensis]|uniref:Uncharacterized protein n=1 Tax=Anopheles sinensis TaxID=74873 RepID=A0A084WFX9_ANOSI|nr:hypothetical protein ZHAS_00017276 [Anopheles sinensis]